MWGCSGQRNREMVPWPKRSLFNDNHNVRVGVKSPPRGGRGACRRPRHAPGRGGASLLLCLCHEYPPMIAKMGLLALVGLAARFAPTAGADVAVGAIRWDAWYGAKDAVGEYVEEALAPEQWRYRLPFFAKEINATVRWGYDARQHSSHHACTATSFSLCVYSHTVLTMRVQPPVLTMLVQPPVLATTLLRSHAKTANMLSHGRIYASVVPKGYRS
jgi:hypothetical protein